MNLRIRKPPVHKMEPAKDKLVEAILFLIARAKKRNRELTQYDIVKSLFFADRSHLNRYGRPITFDNYVAMANGPVPSLAYDVLKGESGPNQFGLIEFPWTRQVGGHSNPKAYIFCDPKRDPSMDVLSESDAEALDDSLATVLSLTFGQIKKLTHDDPAYIEAWGEGDSPNAPLSYGMLFDMQDFEEAEHLQFASRHR
jgi:Protein of unknown function (DUF4065)